MPPILTENSFNDYSTEEDEESQTWPKYLLAAIGTVIGLIVLGVLIWFLIKYLKKRKQKVFEEDEESKLSSIIIDPSNSTVIETEPENQKSVESCSVISADNNSKSENEVTKSIENLKEIATKIHSPTIQRPQHPEETKKSLSKQKVEIPTTNSTDQKLKKVCEMPKKNAETPKKTTTAINVPIIAKKKIVSEEEQEASSKMDGENNASKDLSKEAIVVKKVIVADGGGGEKVNKEIKNVETPKKPKEKIKEDETVKVTENVSVEEEDLKKKKKEEKREKLKKQFAEKAEKKKQKKQKNNKLKQFDSKESWSDPPNSADIYIKTVKPEMPAFVSRTELPSPAATKGASIWSVLRHSVGKDLSRVTVPIHFNEPLSYLQRLAEYMEYISLIKEASTTDDPIKRLELISAFALSNVSSNNVRLSKPFNPLLYETYELSKPQFGFKFIAEQVSHHPPISAFHSQGDEFEFYGNVEPKIKFWGRSLEDNPEAFFTLILKSYNETYTWKAASFSLHNLIMGKMYISLTGCVVIKCLENSLQTKIKFRGAGKQSGADTIFIGEVLKGKKPIRTIYGNWTQYIASTPYEKFVEFKIQWEKEYRIVEKHKNYNLVTLFPESRLLWRIHNKPPNCKEYYNLPYFSLALNEMLLDPLNLPKTDVRFRPDIRQMEEGNLDLASNEKERLEEKQRTTAKEKEGPPEPRWFTLGTDKRSQRMDAYMFNGKYWNRDFSHCEEIY